MTPRRILWFNSLFWEFFTYEHLRRPPFTERGCAYDLRPPYREGVCIFIRFPFTKKSIALGRWTGLMPTDTDEDGEFLSFRAVSWEKEVEGRVS